MQSANIQCVEYRSLRAKPSASFSSLADQKLYNNGRVIKWIINQYLKNGWTEASGTIE